MTRICVITTPSSAATDYYRTVKPLQHIARELPDLVQVDVHEPDRVRWHQISPPVADILVMCRPNGDQYLGIMAEAKKMGVRVWSDFDDDLFNITDSNPATKHFNKDHVKETVRQALAMSDAVTTSTRQLADLYQGMTRNKIMIIPNAWNHYECPMLAYRPQAKPIKMYWRGSATHVHDLYTIQPVLSKIARSKAFTLSMLGLEPWMLPFIEGDKQMEYWKTLYTYLDDLRRQRPDWLLVPLIDDLFNQGKSNIGWLEVTHVGAAVLAPAGLPEWVRPGIINYEDAAHLMDIVRKIGKGEIMKTEYVEQSRTWINEHLRLDKVNELRVRIIEALTQGRRMELKTIAK